MLLTPGQDAEIMEIYEIDQEHGTLLKVGEDLGPRQGAIVVIMDEEE